LNSVLAGSSSASAFSPRSSRVELRLERNGNLISAGVNVAPAKTEPQHAGN
jgi:hypothetical protein